MKITSLQKNFGSIRDFIEQNKDKLFRMWYEDTDDVGANYIYIVGSIPLPEDIMLLIQHYDDSKPDFRYPSIGFIKLSEISLAYYEDDQED